MSSRVSSNVPAAPHTASQPQAPQVAVRALPDALADLRALRTTRRTRLRDLTSQADTLAGHLRTFANQYEAQMGSTLQRLDAARIDVDQWQRRREAARQSSAALEQLNAILQTEDAADATREADERAERAALAEATSCVGDLTSVEPDPDDVRAVYRRLAQRHHPDLADDADERAEREAAMQRINTALQRRDLTLLREIEQEGEQSDHEQHHAAAVRRLTTPRDQATVLRDLARYDLAIAQQRARLAAHRSNSLYRLWQRCQKEPRLLHWLAAAARRELQELDLTSVALQREVAEICRVHTQAEAKAQAEAQVHVQAQTQSHAPTNAEPLIRLQRLHQPLPRPMPVATTTPPRLIANPSPV